MNSNQFFNMDKFEFDSFLLKKLMNHLPASIFFKDKKSRFIRINKTCAVKFGLESPDEAIGKTDFDFFGEKHAKKALKDEKTIMETGEAMVDMVEKEVFSYDKNKINWASTTKYPLMDKSGTIIGTFGISRDITEKKQMEQSLRESEKKYRNIFENIQDVIYRTDRNGIVTDISPSIEKYSGYKVKDIIGAPAKNFYYYKDDWMEINRKLLNNEKVKNFEIRLETLNNKAVQTSVNAYLLKNDQGKIIGVEGIMRDITYLKKAEEKLRKSDETLQKLSRQVPGLIYQFRQYPEGHSCFPFASDSIREIYEVDPEEVRRDSGPAIDRIHKDDLEKVTSSINHSFQTLEKWENEYRVVLPDKGVRWLHGHGRPEKLNDGSVMWHGYINDITKQKKIQQTNTRLRKQFQAVFDTVPNIIFVKDNEGRHVMANKATAEYHGLTQEEIIGKTDVELGTDHEEAKRYEDAANKVLETGEPYYMSEVKTVNPRGDTVWFQIIKVPFHQPDEKDEMVLSVVTDITLLKQKQQELRDSLDVITDQNQRLSNFAHIASHNLRNYAGNISMLISHYEFETDKDEQDELLCLLKTSSERLNETIRDLNELIDSQKITEKDLGALNLKNYASKIKEILTNDIISKNVKLNIDVPDEFTVKSSSAYLESILFNLLSNGVKYSHPKRRPKVELKARKIGEEVEFSISDNGIGIDLEKHGDHLFGIYKTFHGNKDSKGIGLFITKNQVEALNGTIDVESELDKGTTFKVRLPSG